MIMRCFSYCVSLFLLLFVSCVNVSTSVLVFVGIFVLRFASYMMHMTYGMSL